MQKNEKGPLSHQKIKCLFLDYIQLLMIGWVIWVMNGDWNAKKRPPKSSKNKMFIFWWSTRRSQLCHPSPAKEIKCSFLGYVQLLVIGRAGWWTRTPSTTPLQPKKNKMLIFALRSTSDDRSGWSMDSNPVCHPSPVKKIKCSFLDYVQLLMIGRAGWWTRTPSATPLQQKKYKMLIFGLRSTSDDRLG